MQVADASGGDRAEGDGGGSLRVSGAPGRYVVRITREVVVSIDNADISSKSVTCAMRTPHQECLIRASASQGYVRYIIEHDLTGQAGKTSRRNTHDRIGWSGGNCCIDAGSCDGTPVQRITGTSRPSGLP